MSDRYIIELNSITKTYEDNGFTAVEDFNLKVKQGEFVTFFIYVALLYFPALEWF